MAHAKLTFAFFSALALAALLGGPSAAAACPNEAFRSEHPSADLPDCRAYEQASPVDKNGGDVAGLAGVSAASPDGGRVSFFSVAGVPGGVGAQNYPVFFASRGEGGWSTQGLFPPPSFGQSAGGIDWTPDLAYSFADADKLDGKGKTFLLRSSADGFFSTVAPYANVETNSGNYHFAGTSADHSKVLFEANVTALTPEALPGKNNLYVWDRDTGSIKLAGVLPDSACGSPPCAPPGGSFAGPYDWWLDPGKALGGGAEAGYYTQQEPAVANDGSVYFTAGGTGQIYLRTDPADPGASTVQVSASKKTNGAGEGGRDVAGEQPAAFQAATPDGTQAFFTSTEKLTNDATTGTEPPPPAIARAGIGGGVGSGNLSFLPAHAAGIDLDAEHIYWANPAKGSIGRAKLNGSGSATLVEEEFIKGADNPRDVAVDSEHIYWTNAGEGKEGEGSIGRADIVGTPASVAQDFIVSEEVETEPGLFATTISDPHGIDVDSEHIYWGNVFYTEEKNGGGEVHKAKYPTVARANVDGTGVEQKFIQVGGGGDVAVSASKIYYSGIFDGTGYVGYANLDGNSNSLFPVSGPKEAPSLALDASHLYWTNNGENRIARSNLDGTGPEESFIPTAGHPKGLADNAEHIYWSSNQDQDPNPGNDLYRYDAATKELTDLTADPGDENGAEVQGVIGVSDDGSYVYFVANGDLDGPDGPATHGDCHSKGSGNAGYTGTCNLYLRHGATTTLVARLDAASLADDSNWFPIPHKGQGERSGRVSPDGSTLLFRSTRQLTAYDNHGVAEVYRYRVGEPGPVCVSCDPDGTAPVGEARLKSRQTRVITNINPTVSQRSLTRNLSADGSRVFFESPDTLVEADVNGEEGCPDIGPARSCQDVYEWEAPGTGSCEDSSPAYSAQNQGCIYLISSGKGPDPSFLADASASGEDVFFFTREALVPGDGDELVDVYDARVDGGLPSQNQVPPVPCESEACKGAASAQPGFESPGSTSFAGPGNAKPKGHRAKKPRHHRKKRHGRDHRKAIKTTGRASR